MQPQVIKSFNLDPANSFILLSQATFKHITETPLSTGL